MKRIHFVAIVSVVLAALAGLGAPAQEAKPRTVALWLFDEQAGVYPSTVLTDSSPNDYLLVIGNGGQIVPGKFGNALEPVDRPPIVYPNGPELFGLRPAKKPEGRTVEPMTWESANFAGLMTRGEHHLRGTETFANATDTRLNLGAFDWTVEFWFRSRTLTASLAAMKRGGSGEARNPGAHGVVFEVGQGPRGENEYVTRLSLDGKQFVLYNQPSGTRLAIPTNPAALNGEWHHFAFVYSSPERQLRHYVDGQLQRLPAKCTLRVLEHGEEAYFSVGRDGLWREPLPGALDELRFSEGAVYQAAFTPSTFAETHVQPPLKAGLPLLFASAKSDSPIALGDRKYVFIDDAIVAEQQNVTFTANPPRLTGAVIEASPGHFTKHLTVIEDEGGLIRVYYEGPGDTLAVMTSTDGVHWQMPDVGQGEYNGARNIVIRDKVRGTGTVFIDPNAPPEQRWKFIGGNGNRGIYAYSSPDGLTFRRHNPALLPFPAGSQSSYFYDEQRQLYMAYLRTMIGRTPGGATQRQFAWTGVKDLLSPWPFPLVTVEQTAAVAKERRLRNPLPWYLDNGPLAPGGIGLEFPLVFAPDPALDPPGTDVYVIKATKYAWAPDTYLAFPSIYFQYAADGPKTRQAWRPKERGRGSGVIEAQLAVSRDGLNWKRFPRPVYVGLGQHNGLDLHMIYMAQGMVRRGDEIWQYYLGDANYHSTWSPDESKRRIYRAVQRLDGFVSADTPYTGGVLKTKLLTFKGNRLVLNIDTAAAGDAQVGILDSEGRPIPGYALDDCLYINGDFTRTEVEWLGRGKDLSQLQGRPVQLVFRMRGAKLYSMQFTKEEPSPAEASSQLRATSQSQQPAPPPDPVFAKITDQPGLPRVLLIGDSISMGYTLPVRRMLAGKANVHRILENGGPTINAIANIDSWLGKGPWDAIHFNWGLHDLKIMGDGLHQVPIDQYEQNLLRLVKRLKQTKAGLVWASTTPVPEGRLTGPSRRSADVPAYNAAAARIMRQEGVRINDLYAFALPQLAEIQRPANVHFTDQGYERLAERVAASITGALEAGGPAEPAKRDSIGQSRFLETSDTVRFEWTGGRWKRAGDSLDNCMNNYPPRLLSGRLFMTCRDNWARMHSALAEDAEGKRWTVQKLPGQPSVTPPARRKVEREKGRRSKQVIVIVKWST